MSTSLIQKELKRHASAQKAKSFPQFFQAYRGGYGEGDRFLGVTVPHCRKVARPYLWSLDAQSIHQLLQSPLHEMRFVGLVILVERFKKALKQENQREMKALHRQYLKNICAVNNWDLVDVSAPWLMGGYLQGRQDPVLLKLARSSRLWERRIAMLATFYPIRKGDFRQALRLAEVLVRDEEDLIQKAVGWMLREIGNRDLAVEKRFLKKHYRKMPRVMLRYAIEKFPAPERKAYYEGRIS